MDPEDKNKSEDTENQNEISNTEWGLVIGALFVVDGIQLGLNLLFQSGVLLNRFIDIPVGMAWAFYLYMRGVKLNTTRSMSIALTFLVEEIPDVDSLPLWGLDGLFMFFSVRAEKTLKEKTGISLDTVTGGERKMRPRIRPPGK